MCIFPSFSFNRPPHGRSSAHSSARCLPTKSTVFRWGKDLSDQTCQKDQQWQDFLPDGHYDGRHYLCPHRMSGLCLHRALALYLLFFWMPSSDAFLKGFDFVDAESPGRSCMVHGRSGVCMYSMVCTYAGGQHLGTCRLASASRVKVKYMSQPILLLRDRFIFGSCCRLPGQATASEWEERANSLPVSQVR